MRHYRIISFRPRPLSGGQVPVAALVLEGAQTRAVVAKFIPDARCLGGAAVANTLRVALRSIECASRFDELPEGTGPYFTMSEPRALHSSIDDATKWLAMHVLPTPAKRAQATRQGTTHRETFGMSFFKTWGVARWVKPRLRPETLWGSSASKISEFMPSITHWVRGKEATLLLEPIAPARGVEDELKHVVSAFSTLKGELERRASLLPAPRFLVYALANVSEKDRQHAADVVADLRFAEFVDGALPSRCEWFASEIATHGREGDAQGTILSPN